MLPVGIVGLILPDRTVNDWNPKRAEVLEVIKVKAIIGIKTNTIAVKIISDVFFT